MTGERLLPWGLSPRVRGKRLLVGPDGRQPWSIPACAGEAGWCGTHRSSRSVYPRVCGGSEDDVIGAGFHRGLSPRVRGKPPSAVRWAFRIRSIPACAGEALNNLFGPLGWTVYPRVCGGSPRP